MTPPPAPSWRKPAGVFLILLWIALWAVLVATVADRVMKLPTIAVVSYFCIAGIVWIVPLKPLLRWIETGRFRGP